MQNLYRLSSEDIAEHVELLRAHSDLVSPTVHHPVVLSDSNDDPIIYTAVSGRADILCTLDRDFYANNVQAFCRERGIEIMNDLQLLQRLRGTK
jgi:predicted nucleic acid-binding protein